MTFSGEAYHILLVFAQIILVILVLHIVILLYEYLLAGGLSHKNPFKLLLNMLPATSRHLAHHHQQPPFL